MVTRNWHGLLVCDGLSQDPLAQASWSFQVSLCHDHVEPSTTHVTFRLTVILLQYLTSSVLHAQLFNCDLTHSADKYILVKACVDCVRVCSKQPFPASLKKGKFQLSTLIINYYKCITFIL